MIRGQTWRKFFAPTAALILAAAAAAIIYRFLGQHGYGELRHELRAIALDKWLASAAATLVAYGFLSAYDILAVRFVGKHVPWYKVLLTSFTAFAFSNSIGLANLAGSSVRMRLYSAAGLSTPEIIKIIAFVSTSFWLGFFALAGFTFTFGELRLPPESYFPAALVPYLGLVFLAAVAAYMIFTVRSEGKARVFSFEFDVPHPLTAAAQILIAAADWTLAAWALYLILPDPLPLKFPAFLAVFLSAQVIALTAHIPGGLGVLEAVVVFFIGPEHAATPSLLAALLAYRLIYYFGPLCLAGTGLVIYEVALRRHAVSGVSRRAFTLVKPLVPPVTALFTFMAGTVLLVSGTTPNLHERTAVLRFTLPLELLELAHFLGSCVGVVLLALALGLLNKTRAAWRAALVALVAGAVFSLLKGLDYEEATLLLGFAAILYAARSEFHRSARLLHDSWSAGWIVAAIAALGGSVWLGFFSYRHVEYAPDLWWQFRYSGDAPRFLRATAGTVLTALGLVAYRFFDTRKFPDDRRNVREEDIREITAQSRDTYAQLALLGDKRLFPAEDGRAFIMYGVQGSTWVALGDPVGARESAPDLIHDFLDHADRFGAQAVFYQISADALPDYIDLGMNFLKLGEEALVPLEAFSLEGRHNKSLRNSFNKWRKEGVEFRVHPRERWPELRLPIKEVSDLWLADKGMTEKGFSLGYFDEDYLSRYAIATLEKDGVILAFANIWEGAENFELSLDLMRYRPEAGHGLMEHLTLELMLWGKERGFVRFNLGMAPLSGLDKGPHSSRWNKIGGAIFEHGERFYNFQGLRRYKEKFGPIWVPKYLAYANRLGLPLALKDLTTLIGSGRGR